MFPKKFEKLIENFEKQQVEIRNIFLEKKVESWKILLIDEGKPSDLIANLPFSGDSVVLVDPKNLTSAGIIQIKEKLLRLLKASFFDVKVESDFEKEMKKNDEQRIRNEFQKAMAPSDFLKKIDEKKSLELSVSSINTQSSIFFNSENSTKSTSLSEILNIESKNLLLNPQKLSKNK